MKSIVLVVGMPGAGKDTQVELLKDVKPIEIIRIGDLIREKSKSDVEIARVLSRGGLVDNKIVDGLVADKIFSSADGSTIVSDGFPRDLPQAEWLDQYIQDHDVKLERFIYLNIPDEESVARLLKRGREDDNPSTIKKRIDVFHDRTKHVLRYYKNKNIFVEVDGVGSIEEIHRRILGILNW